MQQQKAKTITLFGKIQKNLNTKRFKMDKEVNKKQRKHYVHVRFFNVRMLIH